MTRGRFSLTLAAMTRWFITAAIALGALTGGAMPADAQRLVYFVRHAERADGGAPPAGMTAPADPDLSAEGRARADRLASMLADAGITRVVVTEFRLTVQTAEPLLKRLGLSPERVTAADAAALASQLATYRDDVVLVVGHSNSVPNTIAAMGGPKVTVADNEYSSFFVYVPATRTLSRLRY